MPNLVGLEYPAAQVALQNSGVLVPAALGYFGVWPITVLWQASKAVPSTVLSQSVAVGVTVAANAALKLGLAQFPMAVASP